MDDKMPSVLKTENRKVNRPETQNNDKTLRRNAPYFLHSLLQETWSSHVADRWNWLKGKMR